MNEIMNFEGNDVEVIQNENGELLFEIYSTGKALGYARSNGKSAGEHDVHPKLFPYKSRIDTVIHNAEITPCVRNGHKYINESQLYDFMLEARTDKCRIFRKWVTNEVLPSIRKTGNYTVPQAPSLPYTYINKTFRGRPVLTATDISNLYGLSNITLYNFIKKTLTPDLDYTLLEGDMLKEYTKENPQLPRSRKSLFIIYNTGLSRIMTYYELNIKKTPAFMAEARRSYVVQADVRRLMEYVRKEIKGVEALTYLIESEDSPTNLENYRRILTRKLSAINWWKCDVATIKLGIEPSTISESNKIHNGDYGIRY